MRKSDELHEITDHLIAAHPLMKGFDAAEFRALPLVVSGTEQLAHIVFEWSDRYRSSPDMISQPEQLAKALHDIDQQ